MKVIRGLFLLLAVVPLLSAATVYWTDWQSADSGHVYGVITLPGTTINVTYTGGYHFAQVGGVLDVDYWVPNAYVGGVIGNAPDSADPPGSDIIALGTGAGGTFAFSETVLDPVMGVVSINGPVLIFSAPLVVLSTGCGYFGCGTLSVDPVTHTLYATGGGGDAHGSVEFPGSYSSISFTESGNEYWRGLTVGVLGEGEVPEPATVALFGLGLAGIGLFRRRR